MGGEDRGVDMTCQGIYPICVDRNNGATDMHTCTTELYLLGTLWEVEIEFSYDPAEPDVGLAERVYVDNVWLLGYAPEGDGKYIACHIKADLKCMSPADYEICEYAVHKYIRKARQEV
jgi:hypothetical protein